MNSSLTRLESSWSNHLPKVSYPSTAACPGGTFPVKTILFQCFQQFLHMKIGVAIQSVSHMNFRIPFRFKDPCKLWGQTIVLKIVYIYALCACLMPWNSRYRCLYATTWRLGIRQSSTTQQALPSSWLTSQASELTRFKECSETDMKGRQEWFESEVLYRFLY